MCEEWLKKGIQYKKEGHEKPPFFPGSDLFDTLVGDNSIKKRLACFCGMSLDALTVHQREFFEQLTKELTLEEVVAFSDTIKITNEQIEFYTIWLALQYRDFLRDVNKSSAEASVNQIGNWWRLPKDIESWDGDRSVRFELYPDISDYDAMIMQMPWKTNIIRARQFMLLTEMYWRYRTSTIYKTYHQHTVLRQFKGPTNSESYDRNCCTTDENTNNVRLVKDI